MGSTFVIVTIMMRKRQIQLLLALLLLCGPTALAQRGQWTEEQCRAWQEHYGPIRGINCPYPPCGAVSQREALGLCARLGYNSVRWWPAASTDNAEVFIGDVKRWATWAEELGMTVSPVFSFAYSFFGTEGREEDLQRMLSHVRRIAREFRGDGRIVMWDIFNEPPMSDQRLTPRYMEWIDAMADAMRQEGCTQPITASIVWDADIAACTNTTDPLIRRRHETERRMDLHNFHSYNVQEHYGASTQAMVERFGRMDGRPLVCTECMTRTNGSTLPRSLAEFSRWHINFYSWGLYTCDSNWEVPWDVSNYFNNEPMFHNLLYADGDPYNPAELPFVRDFHFAREGEQVDPGAEWTEVWARRRAWKWMDDGALCGLASTSMATARSALAMYGGRYRVVAVPVSYGSYRQNPSALLSSLQGLADQAEARGMRLMPMLLTAADVDAYSAEELGTYVYQLLSRFQNSRAVAAWCVVRQRMAGGGSLGERLPLIMRRARYAAACQPLLCAPLADGSVQPDTLATDLPNLMWRLSDGVALCTAEGAGAALPASWLETLAGAYGRPLFHLSATDVDPAWARLHVNWTATPARARALAPQAAVYAFSPMLRPHTARWQGWEAWQWMNRRPTVGLHFDGPEQAIDWTLHRQPSDTVLNSLSVQLDYAAYMAGREAYLHLVDSLLQTAAQAGLTVTPQLLTDKYATTPWRALARYVADVVAPHAADSRVLAWDLYHQPCATVQNQAAVVRLIDQLFAAVRALGPVQPLTVTPAVRTAEWPAGFDYLRALTHSRGAGGWDRLEHFGGGSESLTYSLWCQSDIISFSAAQRPEQVGWLLSQAKKFGRPLLCTRWTPCAPVSSALANFMDMHVGWYATAADSPDPQLLRGYGFLPVSTPPASLPPSVPDAIGAPRAQEAVSVSVRERRLCVEGAARWQAYDLQGRLVDSSARASRPSLQGGVYVVRGGQWAQRVMVR